MHINERITPKGDIEGHFRRDVRDALDLDVFTRDDQIIEEIRRLKAVECQFIEDSNAVANWKLTRANEARDGRR